MPPLWVAGLTLRKQAYSNILIILQPKKENFQIKTLDIFLIFSQNIDCGCSLEPPLQGGSNEYPQSMFFSRNKKNNVYTCKPQFYYIKVGFNGVKIIQACFRNVNHIRHKYFSPRNKCLGNLASYVFQCGRRSQYVLFDMLNKYSIAQIAGNTFILHLKKKSKQEYIGLPFSG